MEKRTGHRKGKKRVISKKVNPERAGTHDNHTDTVKFIFTGFI